MKTPRADDAPPATTGQTPPAGTGAKVAVVASADGAAGETAARGVVYLSLANAAAMVLGYLLHVTAGRSLGEVVYGRLVVTMTIVTALKALQGAVLVPGVDKALSEVPGRLGAAMRLGRRAYVPVLLATAALLAAGSGLLAGVLDDPAMRVLLLVGAIELPMAGVMEFCRRLLAALRRYRQAAMVTAGWASIRTLATVALLWAGLGAAWAMGGMAAGAAAGGLLGAGLLLACRRRLPQRPYPQMLSRSLAWTRLTVPTVVGTTLLGAMDLWMVKRFLPEDVAGVYGAAFALSRMPQFIVMAMSGVVFPRVSHALAAGRTDLARSVAAEAVRLLLILFVPVCVLTGPHAAELVTLLYDTRYVAAGAPLALLLVSMSLLSLMGLLLTLTMAADRPGARMKLVLSLVPVLAGVNWLLIPRYGMLGAAGGSLGTFLVGTVVAWIVTHRQLGFPWPWATLLRTVLSAGIALGVALPWEAAGVMVVVKLLAMAAAYLALLLALGELRRGDLAQLGRAVWRRRNDA